MIGNRASQHRLADRHRPDSDARVMTARRLHHDRLTRLVDRMALLGDAAHPMLPYLAQGAGMAIEDAVELAAQLQHATAEVVSERLLQFANIRWQRNARVQARALRNGQIFHATGAMRVGRDMGLRLMGARLMDIPWLYGYGRSEAGLVQRS
mgnify:CR=1 FL=1